jgi:hypothetical protein
MVPFLHYDEGTGQETDAMTFGTIGRTNAVLGRLPRTEKTPGSEPIEPVQVLEHR